MSDFSLEQVFNEIIHLAQTRRDHRQALFPTSSFFEGFAGKIVSAKGKEELNAELKAYLETLPEDILRNLVVILHFGKNEEDNNYGDIHSELMRWSKEECISKLLENITLMEFLQDGKSKLKRQGLPLEKL